MNILETANSLARLIERTAHPSPTLLIQFSRACEQVTLLHGEDFAAEHITMPSDEPFSLSTPWGYTLGQA